MPRSELVATRLRWRFYTGTGRGFLMKVEPMSKKTITHKATSKQSELINLCLRLYFQDRGLLPRTKISSPETILAAPRTHGGVFTV